MELIRMEPMKHQHIRHFQSSDGFTLIELLIAMSMAGIVMAVIFTSFRAQQDSYLHQSEVAETQQNLRASLYYIERELRMIGYDPTDAGIGGVFANLTGIDVAHDQPASDASQIAYTFDMDEDGLIDDDPSEYGAFRLNAGDLWHYNGTDSWTRIAENIGGLAFAYFDEDGNDTLADLTQVRTVQVTVSGTTGGKQASTRQFVRTVRCRNLGL